MPNNPESGLWLSELFVIGDIEDEEVEFDWEAYFVRLKDSIRQLAVNRCWAALRDKEGCDNLAGQGWEPSSPASAA